MCAKYKHSEMLQEVHLDRDIVVIAQTPPQLSTRVFGQYFQACQIDVCVKVSILPAVVGLDRIGTLTDSDDFSILQLAAIRDSSSFSWSGHFAKLPSAPPPLCLLLALCSPAAIADLYT